MLFFGDGGRVRVVIWWQPGENSAWFLTKRGVEFQKLLCRNQTSSPFQIRIRTVTLLPILWLLHKIGLHVVYTVCVLNWVAYMPTVNAWRSLQLYWEKEITHACAQHGNIRIKTHPFIHLTKSDWKCSHSAAAPSNATISLFSRMSSIISCGVRLLYLHPRFRQPVQFLQIHIVGRDAVK